jgi:hypothetical protein
LKKNRFIKKLLESASVPQDTGGDTGNKKTDFNKVKSVLESTENRDQLKVAVKTINQFLTKHRIRKGSPEYNYLEKMLDIKKTLFGVGRLMKKYKRSGDESEDLGESLNLINIIREEIEDFQWMKDIDSEKTIDLSKETWAIENDLREKDPHMVAVQEKLFDLGFEIHHDIGKKVQYSSTTDGFISLTNEVHSYPFEFAGWDHYIGTPYVRYRDDYDVYKEVYMASEFLNTPNYKIKTPSEE